jgi:hypothetical protein
MSLKFRLTHVLLVLVVLFGLFFGELLPIGLTVQTVQAAPSIQPVVAIHVSELTQALESLPAVSPMPRGTGFTGMSWFLTSWHYASIYESIKIALESDGTPYQIITDADIAGGRLMDGNSPRYPILISLASEAVDDGEIQPLRDYVSAGGFLFAGSSAFTRRPDGTSRGDFALAKEMGLKMTSPTLQNWAENSYFTHWVDHRLVSPIPMGTVGWNMMSNSDEVVWDTKGAQQIWQTVGQGAEIIATGSGDRPLLATKVYGSGRFIYHAVLNPIVGAGGQDAGMYAYTIYRSAIEWAFEHANLPIIKNSPWPYEFDSAFIVRHDYENLLNLVVDLENSAKYEKSIGVKGDYWFCTGILRTMKESASQPILDSLRRAIAVDHATIGPHNGGYPNPTVSNPGLYEYWHWGPDQMLDRTKFGAAFPQYANGYDYARDSIQVSYKDIENWFGDIDNGREGCGAQGNCPRTWVSPFFNSGRERSLQILSDLNSIVMGEQKISPFPHWTLADDPSIRSRLSPLAIPVSEWFIGSTVAQSIESGHTPDTIHKLVDFYYQKGYLINLYGHSGTESGLMREYASYVAKKPLVWSTNSVGLYDWWVKREGLSITPEFTRTGNQAIARAYLSGRGDAQSAVEMTLPYWNSGLSTILEVRMDGKPADASSYRLTNYGVKVRVGAEREQVEVIYHPVENWSQTSWTQTAWNEKTQDSARGGSGYVQVSATNQKGTPPENVFPQNEEDWFIPGLTINRGIYDALGDGLINPSPSGQFYGYAYKKTPVQPSGDYRIETDIRFLNHGSYGGGLTARLNPATGQRYAVWVNPETSSLRLVRFSDWTHWTLDAEIPVSSVGSNWHHIQMVVRGSSIAVYYDRAANPSFIFKDTSIQSGYAGLDFWTITRQCGPGYDDFSISTLEGDVTFKDDFEENAAISDPWPRLPYHIYRKLFEMN